MLLSRIRALLAVLFAGTLAVACGRDGGSPLTAPSLTDAQGIYILKTINAAPLSPTGVIISDTLLVWDDGLIGRIRHWRPPLDPTKNERAWSGGSYTLDGVTITALYTVFQGVIGAKQETEIGILSGRGTTVKRMTIVLRDSTFSYDKSTVP